MFTFNVELDDRPASTFTTPRVVDPILNCTLSEVGRNSAVEYIIVTGMISSVPLSTSGAAITSTFSTIGATQSSPKPSLSVSTPQGPQDAAVR